MSRLSWPFVCVLACGASRGGPLGGDKPASEDSGDTTPGTTTPDSGGSDSGTPTATECMVGEPDLSVTAAPTVVNLTWATTTPGVGFVAWGYAPDALTWETNAAAEATTEHAIQLVGAAPETTVWWSVRTRIGEELCETAPVAWEVPAADWEDVPFSVAATGGGFTSGFRLVPVGAFRDGPPLPAYVVLVDDLGRVVWSWTVPERYTLSDLHMEEGGVSFLGLAVADNIEDTPGSIHRVRFDRTEEEVIPVPYAHHGFDIHADGRIAWIAAEARYVAGRDGTDGATVAGDVVMVMGAHGEDPVQVFSGWDQWIPNLAEIARADGPSYVTWKDWTHANGLHIRPDGGYLVSFHLINSVVALDATGAYRWMLAGESALYPGDVAFLGPAEDLFTHQHSAIDVEGGVLLFDNGPTGTWSEAAEFLVDEAALTFQRS